ncbi:MAG: ZPR1 zinc finger domain-containing protein [Zestosphaera sp.]
MQLEQIFNTTVECPACGVKALNVSVYIYETPLIGRILLEVWKCSNCGYRRSDVGTAESRDAVNIVFRVESSNDLKALVVKSSSAYIEIPELGIEISPGPASQGYITTVEGVLERVLDNTPSECFNESSQCSEFVKKVTRAMNSEIPFTLILSDPAGKSEVKRV